MQGKFSNYKKIILKKKYLKILFYKILYIWIEYILDHPKPTSNPIIF